MRGTRHQMAYKKDKKGGWREEGERSRGKGKEEVGGGKQTTAKARICSTLESQASDCELPFLISQYLMFVQIPTIKNILKIY